MQGPSNLSNACTSMTAKNRSEKKIVYQKGHHKKSTFWSQNTDLQSNPFASEAPTEATQTNPIFDFSLSCCLEKQDYRNTHLTYTHHVGTNRSPGSCDKQSLYKKLESWCKFPLSKGTDHTSRENRACWAVIPTHLKLKVWVEDSGASQTSSWKPTPGQCS